MHDFLHFSRLESHLEYLYEKNEEVSRRLEEYMTLLEEPKLQEQTARTHELATNLHHLASPANAPGVPPPSQTKP